MIVKDNSITKFQPITLEIDIESLEELEDLLSRLNAAVTVINKGSIYGDGANETSEKLYNSLLEYTEKYSISYKSR